MFRLQMAAQLVFGVVRRAAHLALEDLVVPMQEHVRLQTLDEREAQPAHLTHVNPVVLVLGHVVVNGALVLERFVAQNARRLQARMRLKMAHEPDRLFELFLTRAATIPMVHLFLMLL